MSCETLVNTMLKEEPAPKKILLQPISSLKSKLLEMFHEGISLEIFFVDLKILR